MPNYVPEWPKWRDTSVPYTGRPDFWTEMDWRDPGVQKGLDRIFRWPIKENDPYYWDPPVKDGESFIGSGGRDTQYVPAGYAKPGSHDPMTWNDFKKKLYEDSHQVRDIKKRWDISEQHPGMDIIPTFGHHFWYQDQKFLGKLIPGRLGFWRLGPNFWDRPYNEGMLTKIAASVKYAAYFSFPLSMMVTMAYRGHWLTMMQLTNVGPSIKQICRNYIQKDVHLPVFVAFAWSLGYTFSATQRNKDDLVNPFFGAIGSGLAAATYFKSSGHGYWFFFWSMLVGAFWQKGREMEWGLTGREKPRSMVQGDPLAYKHIHLWGERKPAPEIYTGRHNF